MNDYDQRHDSLSRLPEGSYGYGGYTDPAPGGRPAPTKRKSGNMGKAIALVLACTLAGGGAGVGGAALYSQFNSARSANTTVMYESARDAVLTSAIPVGDTALTPAQLYELNVNSCVGITVESTTNVFGQTSSAAASGSGFVLTEDGYIVTNYHVIERAAISGGTITVSFKDGSSYPATVVGCEPDNDVAVLNIEASGLTPVVLGDSARLVIGESVIAIGNPLGELDYSITDGLISALDRLISTEDGSTLNMLQTNCAINPGNSGGPLFNSYGEVIGITTAKYSSSSSGTTVEGLGFAIPINDIKSILSDLIEYGYVTGKPYMGVQVGNVPEIAQRYGVVAGATIDSVTSGSAAERAGLQVGDIITALDDTAIDSASALTAALSSYRAGDSATLTMVRSNETVRLTITFDDKNEVTSATQSAAQQEQQQTQQQQEDALQDYFSQFPFGNYAG